jgi:hypothetical protein
MSILRPSFRIAAVIPALASVKNVALLVAVLLGGMGVKLIFFNAPPAEADPLANKSVGVDVTQLHQKLKNAPMQKFHDMTLVFPGGD